MQADSNHKESGSTGSHLQRSSHFLQQHLRKLQRKRQRAVLPIISPCLPMALACSFNVSIRNILPPAMSNPPAAEGTNAYSTDVFPCITSTFAFSPPHFQPVYKEMIPLLLTSLLSPPKAMKTLLVCWTLSWL